MATHRIGAPSIGATWAYLLNLWVQFAQGTYTSWAYAMTTLNTGYAVQVTVGLTGGGTDVYTIEAQDTDNSGFVRLRSIFESPGWRTMPQVLLPATVPGGTATDIAFLNGPWQFRQNVVLDWANVSPATASDRGFNGPTGETYLIAQFYAHQQSVTYLDVIGLMFGALTGLDSMLGMPTDFIGTPPPVMMSSGGGSVDLTPLVAAVEDVATREVDYTANQGGAVWSMYGKVRVP